MRSLPKAWVAAAALALSQAAPCSADVALEVTPLQNARDVDFGSARSLGPEGQKEADTVVRQVQLTITSTSPQPYQVIQQITEPWKNEAGEELPVEKVLFFVTQAGSGGTIRFPNPTPLSVGDQEIFLSDASGTSQQLLVTYTVQVPPGQDAGHYRTHLNFKVIAQ